MASSAKWGRLRLVWVATIAAAALLWPAAAVGHVGSPDVYAEGQAGPYRLLVTIRPPVVIPGVAEIEVRTEGAGGSGGGAGLGAGSGSGGADGITEILIAPIPLTGEASLHPPVADRMRRPASDGQFYTGALWIMASGSWQVRFTVNGARGRGVLSIPVAAASSSTRGMQAGLGALLGGLGVLLVAGVVGIVGAAAREAQLAPGAAPTAGGRRRAWVAMGIALAVMLAAVAGGKLWWDAEAGDYARYVYKPLTMQAAVDGRETLHLKIEDPGWLKSRRIDDFVLDHDHPMHLYLIRWPGKDVVYHLHPEQGARGEFDLALPSIPKGRYSVYADVVHATGFPETLVTEIELPEIAGRALAGDDAKGVFPALSGRLAGGCLAGEALGPRFRLADGYTMVWDNAAVLPAKTPEVFAFRLLDAAGKPAPDVALYMGMLGHAAFVKVDGTVFAHVHPSGTASMAALTMAAAQNEAAESGSTAGAKAGMAGMPDMEGMDSGEDVVAREKGRSGPRARVAAMPAMAMAGPEAAKLPNTVGFPYGFPSAGAYRIFVQMKHGATVETGAFDACATAAQAR